ncbi:MAG: type IV pilus secretin PilQ [Sulfuricellaceae bacterium]|nr:type IV pilus secretin PilQ [Sulfuricellaceae bacterium]
MIKRNSIKPLALTLVCASLLLSVITAPAMAAPPEAAASYIGNRIENVDYATLPDGKQVIKLGLKQPLQTLPPGFALNNPPRIALDFPGTANGLGQNTITINQGTLRSLNVVQAGNRTRLVINLGNSVGYETKIDGKTLLITLQASGSTTTAPSNITTSFAETKPSAQPHSIRDIDFRRGPNNEGRVLIDLSDTSTGIDIRKQGKHIVVDLNNTSLPRALERRLDTTDFGTPVETIETTRSGDHVHMVITPKGTWEYSAYQADRQFIIEVKATVDEGALGIATGKGFTGEKLSLNFQNVEVRSVLQVIADFTGLNIVTSDSVTGNLTLRLKDVPWDQALSIILQSKGLDMRRTGNVILIAPREELAAKEKGALEARQQISDLEAVHTESFQMKYQKAADVQKILSDKAQQILSKRGSAVLDARTNTLFVQDTPTKLEEVRKLLSQIDVAVKQVLIDARIVEASDSFSKNIGVRLGLPNTAIRSAGATTQVSTTGKLEDFTNMFPVGGGASSTKLPDNLSVNLPAAGIGGNAAGSIAMIFSNAVTGTLHLELSALEADGGGKVISNPRIVTADQVEATIQQGTQIPYQQATSSGATSISFVNASLSLKVKPQITPDDNIIMDLKINKDSVGQVTNAGPAIDTKQITTQVLVENGGTVVIGGIYTQNKNNTVTKVPLLGDIPVVGNLFKQRSNSDNKTELLIFVTPKILRDNFK